MGLPEGCKYRSRTGKSGVNRHAILSTVVTQLCRVQKARGKRCCLRICRAIKTDSTEAEGEAGMEAHSFRAGKIGDQIHPGCLTPVKLARDRLCEVRRDEVGSR